MLRLPASLVAALLAVSFIACGSTDTDQANLRFEFTPRAGPGIIDQTLTIENPGPRGVAPTLEFTPLDAAGARVDGVIVESAFGSDRGALVVPPGAQALDILRFKGERRYDVEDVKVRTAATAEVDVPPLDGEIIAERVGPDGAVAEYGVPFDRVVVRNPNSAAVRVRVVLLQFDSPRRGEHQQFVRARPIGGVVRLEPSSRRTLKLDRPAVGSVKAYITR